jgi:predicted nucleotidyltransferase
VTVSPDLVNEIVSRILSVCRPDRILLFGSAAVGDMTEDSDVDVLVLEAHPRDTRQESVRIRRRLRGLGVAFDIVVMSTERFERTKDLVGGLAYPASRHGRVVYDAA